MKIIKVVIRRHLGDKYSTQRNTLPGLASNPLPDKLQDEYLTFKTGHLVILFREIGNCKYIAYSLAHSKHLIFSYRKSTDIIIYESTREENREAS